MELGLLIVIYGQASPYMGKYCQRLEDNMSNRSLFRRSRGTDIIKLNEPLRQQRKTRPKDSFVRLIKSP